MRDLSAQESLVAQQLPTQQRTWGILGGMGPLASNLFLDSVYLKCYPCSAEQTLPRIVLRSMPDFPDRSNALFLNNTQTLKSRLEVELDSLIKAGADSIVICCYTLHCVVPALPSRLADRIISLTDVSIRQVKAMKCPSFLLLCTEGARLGLAFEQSAEWDTMDSAVQRLETSRAQELHSAIYDLKRTSDFDRAAQRLSEILNAQNEKVVLLGCTELHAIHRKTNCFSGFQVIDPLDEVASQIAFSNKISGSG